MAEHSAPRFVFVDALRGFAALIVVIFHVYAKNLLPMTGYRFPEPLHSVFANGRLGVEVFFVISGFVIAQSIRNQHITPRFVGRFALRRSIRLDPPYWATIAAMIVLTLISNHAQHERSLPIPSVSSVIAHVFYLQGFFGYEHIVGVFWTLCYEIQFYLGLVTIVGLWRWSMSRAPIVASRWVWFVPVLALSFASITGYVPITKAAALYAWPYFFLGVVVNWTHHREVSSWCFPAVLVATALIARVEPLPVAVAAATSVLIFAVSRAGRLGSLSLGPAVQYLGRISYSLYLVHMLVGTPLVRFGIRHFGKHIGAPQAFVLLLAGVAVSIAAAHVMYVLVERPAMRWSKRVRQRRTEGSSAQLVSP